MKSEIRDPSCWQLGADRIAWAARWMPALQAVGDRLTDTGLLRDRTVGLVLTLEPKTANLALVLQEAGARVIVVCPAAAVTDEVAAALDRRGVTVLARSDASAYDDRRFALRMLDAGLDVLVDDGSEVIRLAHAERPGSLRNMAGAAEETTSGLRPLRVMESRGELAIPCLAVNDARSKYLFDNVYGTGQSCVMAALDLSGLRIAGKVCVVAGYGWVGTGIARCAHALGARVIVSEVNPFQALRAHHDGFEVRPLISACEDADLVFSATGIAHTVALEHLIAMKDCAFVAVGGGVPQEIALADLTDSSTEVVSVRKNVTRYTLHTGRVVHILADGECVNCAAAEGNPIEIMDLSLAVQALAVEHLLRHGAEMRPGVHPLPEALDEHVARVKLDALGIRIDRTTDRQREFLGRGL
ncbi:adenosylhomocysteinase [Rhizohabitans arisaemae]|uniref:adenosylhomocysteinase n=1 Tax=Rhizohabitans arisaemae TaxID=2720610 RepID=UPI0024B21D9C|nr:adenosylhomocysteinase [Rhizohabitans arisaemae]